MNRLDEEELKLRAHASPWHLGVDFLVRQGAQICKFVEMEDSDSYTPAEPTFSLSMTQAQVLIDDLWAAGLRPTEAAGSAGSLAATERHLKDMRTIAFGCLKMEEK